jgi:hypothetical protein
MTAEEEAVAAKLSESDFKLIDTAILAECCERWLKVARIVGRAETALERRFPGLSYLFYTQRLCQLVEQGRLESQGFPLYIRHSEVRLPQRVGC